MTKDIDLVVGISKYGLTFTTDWSLTLAFKQLVSSLLSDKIWNVGTFPNLNVDLLTSAGKTITLKEAPISSSTSSTTSSSTTSSLADKGPLTIEDSVGGDPPIYSISVFIAMVFSVFHRKRK